MAIAYVTSERLKELLDYCPETGLFRWRVNRRPKFKAGDIAGSTSTKGYRDIKIDEVSYRLHRLAWLYMTGEWPKDQLDHINGIKSDNRFANLREVTNAQNCQNQGKRKNNTSGFNGVHWSKRMHKWQVSISVNMKRIHLGYFDDPEQAGAVYELAKAKYHVHSPVHETLSL